MKTLVLAAVATFALTAQADILRRPTPVLSKTVQITDQAALELYESLDLKARGGSSLHTSYSSYKLFRSTDGRTQIVCFKSTNRFNPEHVYGNCKIEQSTSSKKLPRFVHRRRLG